MNKILATEVLTPNSKLFVVEAPQIARKAKPGQFIILRVDENGERIPLTLADRNPEEGTITLIVQQVGKTTRQMGTLEAGDYLADVVGPLGQPTHIEKYGTVLCIGGGFGMAAMYPIAHALKEAGNKLIAVIGARSENLLLWEGRMRSIADEMYVTTDDGSKGTKGIVIDPLKELISQGRKLDLVVAIGPVVMMKAVSKLTELPGIRTMVSLNPIMIDGTGMCGGCRVTVGGQTKFCCVDGPDFDAHKVDWDELLARLSVYQAEEKISLEKYQCEACKSGR